MTAWTMKSLQVPLWRLKIRQTQAVARNWWTLSIGREVEPPAVRVSQLSGVILRLISPQHLRATNSRLGQTPQMVHGISRGDAFVRV